MIVVKGRLMMIGHQDQVVAWSGDNLVEVRVFELPRYYNNIDMLDFDFKLDTEINGVKNIIDLPKTVVDEDSIMLVWTIAESHVTIPGRMFIQIRAFSADEEKWHSSQDYVFVQSSINATDVIPDPLPSEFEQRIKQLEAEIGEIKAVMNALPAAANGLPEGGTAGQVLEKIDSTDYNAQWVDVNARKILAKSVSVADFTGKDGYILAYDETNDIFYLKADDGGGGGLVWGSLGALTQSSIDIP